MLFAFTKYYLRPATKRLLFKDRWNFKSDCVWCLVVPFCIMNKPGFITEHGPYDRDDPYDTETFCLSSVSIGTLSLEGDTLERRICWVRARDDGEVTPRIAVGKSCRAKGRIAGMLTDMIPRLHSLTLNMRHGALSSTEVSQPFLSRCQSDQLFLDLCWRESFK